MSVGQATRQAQAREVAYSFVKDALLSGHYRPAQHLVENLIAEQLGVSKTPVREALTRLAQEGLVDWFPNRGFFVCEYSEQDVQDIYGLREIFEAECARFAAEQSDHAEVASQLRVENEGARDALLAGDMSEVHRHLSRFDGIIFERHDNRLLKKEIEALQARIVLSGVVSNRIPGRIERSLEEHGQIIEQLEAGDAAAAEAEMRKHIRSLLADEMDYRQEGQALRPWTLDRREP